MLWRESQGSLNSSASLDLGFLSSTSTAASPWTEVSRRSAGPAPSRCHQPGLSCCIPPAGPSEEPGGQRGRAAVQAHEVLLRVPA